MASKTLSKQRRLTRAKNQKNLKAVLASFGVSPQEINFIVKKNSPSDKVSKRLRIMKAEGMPLKGLVCRMRLSDSKFDTFVKRFRKQRNKNYLASKRLTLLLPGWKKLKALKCFEPLNILQKVEACLANGIMPTAYIMANYSAKTIADGKATAPNSLKPGKLLTVIGNVDARCTVIDLLVVRPHLPVKKSWLKQELITKHAFSEKQYHDIIEELKDFGVLFLKKGYYSISRNFRTGPKMAG